MGRWDSSAPLGVWEKLKHPPSWRRGAVGTALLPSHPRPPAIPTGIRAFLSLHLRPSRAEEPLHMAHMHVHGALMRSCSAGGLFGRCIAHNQPGCCSMRNFRYAAENTTEGFKPDLSQQQPLPTMSPHAAPHTITPTTTAHKASAATTSIPNCRPDAAVRDHLVTLMARSSSRRHWSARTVTASPGFTLCWCRAMVSGISLHFPSDSCTGQWEPLLPAAADGVLSPHRISALQRPG